MATSFLRVEIDASVAIAFDASHDLRRSRAVTIERDAAKRQIGVGQRIAGIVVRELARKGAGLLIVAFGEAPEVCDASQEKS